MSQARAVINPDTLYTKIIKAEKTGLIERQLVNVNDQPYLSARAYRMKDNRLFDDLQLF